MNDVPARAGVPAPVHRPRVPNLHGREDEKQAVDGLLAGARESRSGVLVVRGEVGIGKTALLDYAADAASGMLVLRAAGVETEAELAFAGLHLLLRPVLARIGTLPGPQEAALRGALGLSERGSEDRFLVGLSVLSLLSDLADEQPVLCLIDDAQWLDTASSDVLLFTARRLEAEGVAMVLASRDGPPAFAAPGLTDLPLALLDVEQAGRLLDERAQHLAPALRDRVLAEAGGNPLALVELAAAVTSNADSAGAEPLPVTHRVQELLAAQIGRLGEPTALVLLLAAAEADGDLALVLEAAEALGAGADALAAAERAGLVAVEQASLVFRHPLVRAAAYHSAPLALRQAAHRALAEVLAGQPDLADRWAWHLAAATSGRDERVAAELERTAERSRGRGSSAAVSAAYERAAQLTPDPEGQARRLLAAATAASDAGQMERAERLACRAQELTTDALLLAEIALVRMVQVSGKQLERITELATAAASITSRHPARAASMLCRAIPAALARTKTELASQLLAQFDALSLPLGVRLRPAEEAIVQRARFAAGDSAIDMTVIRDCVAAVRRSPASVPPQDRLSASVTAFWLGDHDATKEIAATLAADCRRQGMVGWLPGALQGLTMAQILSGEWAQARASAMDGLKLAQAMGQLQRVAFLSDVLGLLAALTGDGHGSLNWLSDYTRLGGDATNLKAHQRFYLALLDLGNGRFTQARDQLAGLSDIWEDGSEFMFLPDLAEAAARSGDLDQARRALARFETWQELTGQQWAGAVAHRCRALLSDGDSAESHYRAAVAGHEQDGRPFERARTHLVYGEWLRRARRRGEAGVHLTTAFHLFEDLGAVSWAGRATAELAAIGAPPADRVARPPGVLARLTPQELQVVRLAASGLSNRDIGAQLFLSPRTVGYHLYKAYPKLHVASRSELCRLVRGIPDAQHAGEF